MCSLPGGTHNTDFPQTIYCTASSDDDLLTGTDDDGGNYDGDSDREHLGDESMVMMQIDNDDDDGMWSR